MRCYRHTERSAVAVCQQCTKGLCPACSVDVGGSVACREFCEADVKDYVRYIRRTARVRPIVGMMIRIASIGFIAPSALIALGHVIGPEPEMAVPFLAVTGLGALAFWAGKRYTNSK